MSSRFVVLVPVKSPGTAKSRLAGVADRSALAAAFARDMVRACLATPEVAQVLVTTDDPVFADALAALGAATTPDAGDGLNGALRGAARVAARRWPGLRPVAVLADLPALRPTDLSAALTAISARAADAVSFVADAEGTGSVLYAAPADSFDPRFGPSSAAAHRAGGAGEIDGELATLRRDVDDAATLHAAWLLGLGPASASLLPASPRAGTGEDAHDDRAGHRHEGGAAG